MINLHLARVLINRIIGWQFLVLLLTRRFKVVTKLTAVSSFKSVDIIKFNLYFLAHYLLDDVDILQLSDVYLVVMREVIAMVIHMASTFVMDVLHMFMMLVIASMELHDRTDGSL